MLEGQASLFQSDWDPLWDPFWYISEICLGVHSRILPGVCSGIRSGVQELHLAVSISLSAGAAGLLRPVTSSLSLLSLPAHLQEKLTDFLPKLLDCSAETRSFQKPPALSCSSAAELHHRFSSVMASLASVPPGAR